MAEPVLVIIDDLREHRQMLEAVINVVLENAKVLHAMRGIDGFKLIQENHKPPQQRVDLVILDLRLGAGFYGFEVLKLIRQIDATIPVVIATADILDASSTLEDLVKTDKYLSYFPKPLDVKALAKTIREQVLGQVS